MSAPLHPLLAGTGLLFIAARVLSSRWRLPLLIVITWVAGAARLSIHDSHPQLSLGDFVVQSDSSYHVSAVIHEVTRTRRGTPKFIMQPFQIDGHKLDHGEMILYSGKKHLDVSIGDTLEVSMDLFEPGAKRNPSDFDYRKYLEARGIYLEGFLADTVAINISPGEHVRLDKLLDDVKGTIKEHFKAHLSPQSAGILSALILGERSDVDESTRDNFANTGVIHVLAVSGLHVGYVTLILMSVLGVLRPSYTVQVGLVILGLGAYVLITGNAASVMRASFMASLILIATLLERRTDIFNTLATAAFIILLIDPTQMANIGFQLSFSAVISIVSIYPVLRSKLPMVKIKRLPGLASFLNGICDLFLVSLAAQLGTLAFTIFYFQKVPLISLIANLVVVPTIGLIVGTGMAFLSLGMLIPVMAQLWAAFLDTIIQLMLWFVSICAHVPWAFLSTRTITVYELIFLIIAVFNLVNPRMRLKLKIWIVLLLIWANCLVWPEILRPQYLELVMLDVGQGDAVIVHTPNNKTLLVDAGLRFGGKDMGADVISPYLRFRGVKRIDLLVLTHPHNDHIGGAYYLVENHAVNKALMQDMDYESYTYQELEQLLSDKQIPVASVYSGMIDSSLAPIYFRITGPARFDGLDQPANVNDVSIVLQMFYGSTTILFTGDAEHDVEKDQLRFGGLLNSDIIKVPHHGSKTSSTDRYVAYVKPKIALISLGKKNKYKHPAPSTLAKYEDLGTRIHRTDLEGAVIYRSDGQSWKHVNWREGGD